MKYCQNSLHRRTHNLLAILGVLVYVEITRIIQAFRSVLQDVLPCIIIISNLLSALMSWRTCPWPRGHWPWPSASSWKYLPTQ